MIRNSTLKFLALLLLAVGFSTFVVAEDIKKIHPAGYVTDLSGVIDPGAKGRLEALCTELQQKTGAQMAIVTVNSLEGESVEEYAVDLYKQLGVGSKGDNRGVLLLVAPPERKYRVEVGYGLEPVINDARAGDAGRSMVPFLRRGDYSGAIESAAWTLAKFVADDRGVTLSGHPPARPPNHHPSALPLGFWGIIFIIWIIASLARGSRNIGPRGGGGGWWIGPMIGGMMGGGWRGGGGFGGSGGGGGGFGGFGGGSSGGGGASGSW
jgi:uncharacterized protein